MARPCDCSLLALCLFFCLRLAPAASSDVSSSAYAAWEDVSWAVWDVKLSPLLGEDKQKLYDNHIAGCRQAAGSKDRADAHCYVDEYVSQVRQQSKKRKTFTHSLFLHGPCALRDCSTECN